MSGTRFDGEESTKSSLVNSRLRHPDNFPPMAGNAAAESAGVMSVDRADVLSGRVMRQGRAVFDRIVPRNE
jgi:hypothetical protein